jgi:hypothetical protein
MKDLPSVEVNTVGLVEDDKELTTVLGLINGVPILLEEDTDDEKTAVAS